MDWYKTLRDVGLWFGCFVKQLVLRVKARENLKQPMTTLYRIIIRWSRAAPARYGHTAVQCACAVDTVTVDKADHSQAWPWAELGGSAPVPLGQWLCLNSTERGESTRTLLSGGLWEDRSRINKGLTVNSTKTGLLLHWTERGL